MKKSFQHIERNRVRSGDYQSSTGDKFGAFVFSEKFVNIVCIVDGGEISGWEHVSISIKERLRDGQVREVTPSWKLMCEIKKAFWDEEECVMQLHPPKSEYVNNCNSCLHLWKPVNMEIPRPAQILV